MAPAVLRPFTARRRLTRFAAGTLVLLLAPAAAGAAPGESFPDVGNRFPSVRLEGLRGESYRIDWARPQPKVTVFFFFEPRCAECFQEFIFFDSLYRLTRGLSLEVFAVEGSGQGRLEVEEALGPLLRIFERPPFPVISDPSYGLSTELNVRRMPTTFLLESHGVVLSRQERFDSLYAVDLARKIERLLGLPQGRLSPALASVGVSAAEEARLNEALELRRKGREDRLRPVDLLAVGASVPPFAFTDLAGTPGSWTPGAGAKPVTVVFFWGALCQPCIREMEYLERILLAARGSGLDVIAVEATGLGRERVAQVMERYARARPLPSYRIVPDPDRALSRNFGVAGKLPQTFFISADGTVLYHTDEFVQGSEAGLAGRIERALSLAPGSLVAAAADASLPQPVAGEAPSVVSSLSSREEEFRASLVRAETLVRDWKLAAAIPHFLRCLELKPDSVPVRELLADVYRRQGQFAKAGELWEQILRLDPGHKEAARRVEELGRKEPSP